MMKALIRFTTLSVLAALLLATGPGALADAPSAPQRLTGQVMPSNNGFDAKLFWYQNPNTDAPKSFEIYQANSKTTDPTLFTKIADITVPDPDPNRNSSGSYHYLVQGLAAGEYSFYVTASNLDGTSPASDIIHLGVNHAPDWVKFTTHPSAKGDPSVEYVYDADATSSVPNAIVKFKALQVPPGTTLDESTGELRYTYAPGVANVITFAIQAYLASDPTIHATQQWTVRFDNSDPNKPRICTVVYGTVVDEQNNPVTEGVVQMMMWTANGYYGPVSTGKVTANGYVIESHTWGKFTLMIDGQFIVPEYFENAADVLNAHEFNTQCGDTVVANFVVQTQDAVWFTSQPKPGGDPNAVYTYDAEAASNVNGVIKFKAVNIPPTATFDETTGELSFTYVPNSSGMVSFEIAAYLESDPTVEAVQKWSVRFGNSDNNPTHCMTFYGLVEDEHGTPVPEGTVTAFWQDGRTGGIVGIPFVAKIGPNGMYQIRVYFEGKYILQANGHSFEMEFYLDAADMQSATVLDVACNDSVEVNFTVDALEYHTISGTVSDKATSQGMQAIVVAYSTPNATNAGYTTKTDAHGNYTLTVPEGSGYYVKAMDLNSTYFVQFYDQAASQTAATPLNIDADKSGIDFELEMKPVRANKIAGTLQDDSNNPIVGIIFAHKIETRGNAPYPSMMYKTTTNNTGAFEFTNLEPGDYVLQAIHTAPGFVPGYYKENDYAVFSWVEATRIAVSENGMITGIAFKLRKTSGIRGNSTFMGNIRGKIGGFDEGEMVIADVVVLLVDQSGKISDWSVSDESGNFIMTNATSGTFTLVADVPGYQLYEEQITLDYSSDEPVNQGIVLVPLSATSVRPLNPVAANMAVSVYPNPAVDAVHVLFNEPAANATVRVYNALGVLVASETVRSAAAGTSVVVNASTLPAGSYYVRIDAGAVTQSVPLHIVK